MYGTGEVGQGRSVGQGTVPCPTLTWDILRGEGVVIGAAGGSNCTGVEQLEPAEVLPGKPTPGSPPSLSALLEVFRPSGGSYGDRAWALVNLICLLLTAYFFLPLLHLKDKFGRVKLLGRLAAEDRSFAQKTRASASVSASASSASF